MMRFGNAQNAMQSLERGKMAEWVLYQVDNWVCDECHENKTVNIYRKVLFITNRTIYKHLCGSCLPKWLKEREVAFDYE